MELSGILLVDKPAGPTSFDVVSILRRALKLKKVGHTGTLDPTATGVLPLCLGEATRVAGYITEGDKAYDATLRLGTTTDTQDAAGKILEQRDFGGVTRAGIDAALTPLRGAIEQRPPMYSAVKIDGQRLYELARKGLEVDRKPRPVTVHSLDVTRVDLPEVDLRVVCSKGTYIRTLAADLGEALGCGAHLTALRRTRSGPFTLADSIPLQDLIGDRSLGEAQARVLPHLLPVERAFVDMPGIQVSTDADLDRVTHGVQLPLGEAQSQWPEGLRVKVVGPDSRLLALAERQGAKLRYLRVLTKGEVGGPT